MLEELGEKLDDLDWQFEKIKRTKDSPDSPPSPCPKLGTKGARVIG